MLARASEPLERARKPAFNSCPPTSFARRDETIMARTQAADYDQKRQTIMAQSARLFALRGFASASISEIAAQCDISKSLIYHYYPSKEDILFAVMKEHMEALLALIEEDAAGDTFQDELRHFTHRLLRVYAGAANHQKVLLYDLDFLPKQQRADIVANQREIIEHVDGLLARASPALKRNRGKLRAKTMLYFGMLNWTHTWFKPSGPLTRDQLADLAVDTILGA